MKNRVFGNEVRGEELVARFGDAVLVRVNGRMQLRGGPMSDRVEALEWVSLFMPEETVEELEPRRRG